MELEIGSRIGKLTIIKKLKKEEVPWNYNTQENLYVTQCDCGRELIRHANTLQKMKSCPHCRQKMHHARAIIMRKLNSM